MSEKYKFSTTIPMVFGQMFVIYRKKNNLTQKDMAEALGVGGANVSKIESGDTVISIEQLFIISLLFKEKTSELLMKFEKALKILNENGILVSNSKDREIVINKQTKTALVSAAHASLALAAGMGLPGPAALIARAFPVGLIASSAFSGYKAYKDKIKELEEVELPIINGDQLYPYVIQAFS